MVTISCGGWDEMCCVLLEMLEALGYMGERSLSSGSFLLHPFYLVLHFTISLARPLFDWEWLPLLSQVCIGIFITGLDKRLLLALQIPAATKSRLFPFVLLSL